MAAALSSGGLGSASTTGLTTTSKSPPPMAYTAMARLRPRYGEASTDGSTASRTSPTTQHPCARTSGAR